jgi:hypothetical protein
MPSSVDEPDADVWSLQHFAQLVSHQVDDRLEVELRGDALLDAVDDRELAGALLELGRALGDLALQARRRSARLRARRRPGREHGEQITVAVVEAAESAVDVAVDVTQQLALDDQRDDQVASLVDRLGAVGHMAQVDGAVAPRFCEPRGDRFQQSVLVLAFGYQGARYRETLRCIRASRISSTRSAPDSSVTSSTRNS